MLLAELMRWQGCDANVSSIAIGPYPIEAANLKYLQARCNARPSQPC